MERTWKVLNLRDLPKLQRRTEMTDFTGISRAREMPVKGEVSMDGSRRGGRDHKEKFPWCRGLVYLNCERTSSEWAEFAIETQNFDPRKVRRERQLPQAIRSLYFPCET